eukprot:TRINITY_DN5729_c0_g1_i1.p1 TRINITY_DN5729_c0_g1~~TRINITY_DN5729_c0_g1_i1.p1  ORF type:complete len:225 (-),score=42.63 TRINITY_DN5729_c0_g1_i1:25-615(-)
MDKITPIKIVIVGDGAVGKTCILVVYTTNVFPKEYVPTVFENYSANVQVGNRIIALSLWDTAGQEDYDRIRPLSYSETDVFLVCFSVINATSFANVKTKWWPEIMHHYPSNILLVGTKIDLREDPEKVQNLNDLGMKVVTTEEGHQLGRDIQAIQYMECSARLNRGLKDVFDFAIQTSIAPKIFKKAPKVKRCTLL